MTAAGSTRRSAPRRRRGSALEAALLDAAWEELVEKGYDRFTIESVAERAHTSRDVIYRRWPGKAELLQAAVVRAGKEEQLVIPDTGTLRGDLIELLQQANRTRAQLGVQMILQLGGYHAETGASLADLRSAFLSERGSAMQTILDRAVARGEVDPAKLTPRVIAVPFDLYRQELLMTLKAPTGEAAESIVDEVFLPLVATAESESRRIADSGLGSTVGRGLREDRRMIDHLGINCSDIDAASRFYDAVLATLGHERVMDFGVAIGYGTGKPDFWIAAQPADGPASGPNREIHVAFAAPDAATVRAFFAVATSLGAEVLHEPRMWPEYHDHYYGAFVRDPDGNNVEVVCHTANPGD